MPQVSKEQIAAAKEIDLFTYLQNYAPGELVKEYRDEYHLKSHESLKLNSGGYWHWMAHPEIKGRSYLDYLVKVERRPFPEAVLEILDGRFIPAAPEARPPTKPKKPFQLPDRYRYADHVSAYLSRRGIVPEVLRYCFQAGILYESTYHHNCVFVGLDMAGKPRFACVRSILDNFRMDVESSDKEYAFSIPAREEQSTILAAFEAPVDLLSDCSIQYLKGGEWRGVHRIAMAGTSGLSIHRYLKDHPWIDTVHLCRDNDKAGLEAADSILPRLREQGYTAIDAPPPAGKDYNDWLIDLLHRQKKEVSR